MRTPHPLLVVPLLVLTAASVARGIVTYSPAIRSSEGDNFNCIALNLGAGDVQVTAEMDNGLGSVLDSGTLSVPAGQSRRIAGNQAAVFGGYCRFTFDADPAAVRGVVALEDAGGSDTRLIYSASPVSTTGPPLDTLLATPPVRSSESNNLDCVVQNLSSDPVQVINVLNDGVGNIVNTQTLTVPAGQVRTLASTTSQVFGAYCTFHFQARPDNVRGFATREDAGGSNTRLLVEATPTVTTIAAPACCGDCNGDGAVTIDEIITSVNLALTSCPLSMQ